MALDSRIVLLAKAYAAQLRKGETGDVAREYIETRFGAANEADVDRAIYEAQRGVEVGRRLQELHDVPSIQLSAGCLGDAPCVGMAQVRVTVFRDSHGTALKPITLYRAFEWYQTIADVDAFVHDYIDSAGGEGYDVTGVTWAFEGPTFDL